MFFLLLSSIEVRVLISRIVVAVTCAALLISAGCGGGGGKADVTGRVTVDGQPVPEGTLVTFSPAAGSGDGLEVASGRVDGQGNYTLYSGIQGEAGVAPGKYKVHLTPAPDEDASYMDANRGGTPQADLGVIPKEYSSAATTPQEVDVEVGKNTIDIAI